MPSDLQGEIVMADTQGAVAAHVIKTASLQLDAPDADGIAVLWIDCLGKKVNTLSTALLPEFDQAFAAVQANKAILGLVVASGKDSGFIAGADIEGLATVRTAGDGQRLSAQAQAGLAKLEKIGIPVVAAIHGECLGGGLELALACTKRVASLHRKTKMALPEVMLGLLPGAGGTVRLPKLVGLADALDMMLTGKNIRAEKAVRMGLVHAAVPHAQLLASSKRLARDLVHGKISEPNKKKPMQEQVQKLVLEQNALGRMVVLHEARKKVMAQSKGLYPAPLAILDVVAQGTFTAEAEAFGKLLMTPESKGLRHLFFAITHCKKDESAGVMGVQPRKVGRVGMLGAGLMGAGIATVLADQNETPVRLKDRDHASIGKALDYARKVYGKARKRKIYGEAGQDQRLARISGGTDWSGFGLCDMVIEAVFEDLALKQKLVAEVEGLTRADAIFATNTSSLPIGAIAAQAKHPERVIGMHFFSPVEKMPLVEIIVTPQTAPAVTATTVAVARKMGKHVIVVNDCAGFYTSRALVPYMTEAMFLAGEGYALEDVDEAATRMGFPVGPITLMDEVGIDVGQKVLKIIKHYYGERMEFPPDHSDKFVQDGRLGRKANKGFFLYENGKSVTDKRGRKVVDEAVYAHLPSGKKTRPANLPEMGERMVLGLVNEAVLCLQEGVLRDAWSGDLGAVFGIGFPPFEGGPFQYVDRHGAKAVVEKLRAFQTRFGKRFEPCAKLVEMAEKGERFFG
jgi:3-hydroxyacyl-CoA dehydrogenase/enoyl-CoA hydratase/3-hydroxybutyryl-CoA epimerase